MNKDVEIIVCPECHAEDSHSGWSLDLSDGIGFYSTDCRYCKCRFKVDKRTVTLYSTTKIPRV